MEVVATARGFYKVLREPGDVFSVPEGSTATWFERTEGGVSAPPEPDLKSLKVAELRELAEQAGINHEGMKKAELREALYGS